MRAAKEANGKRAAKVKPDARGPSLVSTYALPMLLAVLGVGLLLLGLILIGQLTRDQVRDHQRYAVAFGSIRCLPPPARGTAEFLAEVQYLAGMPDRLRLLDEDLAPRLAGAFARHPWVERVQRVTLVPPRQIDVHLVYRTPALAVLLAGQRRAVDTQGIVLPDQAGSEGLSVFTGQVAPPVGPAGHPWGDRTIEAAAQTAGYLLSSQKQFQFATVAVEEDSVVLRTAAGTRILWGQPPGKERPGEASAPQKRQRLLTYWERQGGLDQPAGPYLHDLRPAAAALHQPLPAAEQR